MERVKERTLVGKCPLPDIAAARKSLYFCIRQETPEACKRVSLFPSAWVEMVSPVICTLYCWHRCLHTGQATAIKSLVGGGKKTGIYECKIGERGKKKGWEMMSAMFTRAYLTQGGSSRHYYTSISEHCVIFLDILFLSWHGGDLQTFKHHVTDLDTISEISPCCFDMVYSICVVEITALEAERSCTKRHEQAAFEQLI